jgi:hypothetical protein
VFNEDADTIMSRVAELMELDSVACRMLSTACILIPEDSNASALLQRVREHMRITEDNEAMFEANYYLDYIKDLLEILDAISSNGPLPEIRETIRDHYETLLYNRELLLVTLGHIKRESEIEARRENYWMN